MNFYNEVNEIDDELLREENTRYELEKMNNEIMTKTLTKLNKQDILNYEGGTELYKYNKQTYQHYKIFDAIGFPVCEIYNKNFKIHVDFHASISHHDLVNLLNQINELREKFKIDVGYGNYVLNTK